MEKSLTDDGDPSFQRVPQKLSCLRKSFISNPKYSTKPNQLAHQMVNQSWNLLNHLVNKWPGNLSQLFK